VAASQRTALVHGVPLGLGGLGVQAGNILCALASQGHEVHAIGPGCAPDFTPPPGIVWHRAPASWTPLLRWTPLRRRAGATQFVSDWRIGRFAVGCLRAIRPDLCYVFTQVGLEPLLWANAHGIPAVLESPNGHIRAFRQVYVDEAQRWCGAGFTGHPTERMVARVEREYAIAPVIRVSSLWARDSLVAGKVPATRIRVLQQPVDLARFEPGPVEPSSEDALRVTFVGSLDLRKGFVYLLRAARMARVPVTVTLVGGTGDPCSRQLLEKERRGVEATVAPGDPRPVLARSDLFVLPTLEDGSPFAVAEAMASGVPVVTTTSTGAAEWIEQGRTGWVVPPRSVDSLVTTLEAAYAGRHELSAMGAEARAAATRRVAAAETAVADWIASL
jgi:glycosyltransferase involved in cell wall biosynthesis